MYDVSLVSFAVCALLTLCRSVPQKCFLTHSKTLQVTYTLSKRARKTRKRENVLFILFVNSTGMTTLFARNPKDPAGGSSVERVRVNEAYIARAELLVYYLLLRMGSIC